MGLDQLRQGADSLLRNRRSSGGGRRANWNQRFDIPIKPAGAPGDISEPVIFGDAAYDAIIEVNRQQIQAKLPFFKYRVHRYGQGTKNFVEIICSAGDDGRGDCVGCYDYSHGKKWAEPKDKLAFNIIHLGWYHDTPLLDRKTGQPVMKREDQTQYVMVKTQCEATGAQLQCKWCQAGYQRTYGGHRYIEVGTGHLESIRNMDTELSQTCVNCGSQVLTPPGRYHCPNCKVDVVDVATAGFTSQEQLAAYIAAPQPCYQCQNTEPLVPTYECGFVKGQKMGRCCPPGQTRVATLFDAVIYLYREKGKLTTLIGTPKMSFDQFVAPQGGKTPAEVLADVYKAPFDFAELYKPNDVKIQAERLGCPNPFAPQGPAYQPYPGAPQGAVPPPPQYPGQQQQQPQQPQYQQPPAGPMPPPYAQPQFPPQQQAPWQGQQQVPPPPPQSPGMPGGVVRPNYGK